MPWLSVFVDQTNLKIIWKFSLGQYRCHKTRIDVENCVKSALNSNHRKQNFTVITNWGGGNYQLRSALAAKQIWVAVITIWGTLETLPLPRKRGEVDLDKKLLWLAFLPAKVVLLFQSFLVITYIIIILTKSELHAVGLRSKHCITFLKALTVCRLHKFWDEILYTQTMLQATFSKSIVKNQLKRTWSCPPPSNNVCPTFFHVKELVPTFQELRGLPPSFMGQQDKWYKN